MVKKRKWLIIGLIICLCLTGVSLFIASAPMYKTTYDNSNTVEHSATVKNVIPKDKGFEIEVNEYSCNLYFSDDKIVDEESLLGLHYGDKITFNVPKSLDATLSDNNVPTLGIVTLKTGNVYIVTFESHNRVAEKSNLKLTITACVFSVLFFSGAVICIVFLIKKQKINNRFWRRK